MQSSIFHSVHPESCSQTWRNTCTSVYTAHAACNNYAGVICQCLPAHYIGSQQGGGYCVICQPIRQAGGYCVVLLPAMIAGRGGYQWAHYVGTHTRWRLEAGRGGRHCVGTHTRWRLEAGRGGRHCVGLHTRWRLEAGRGGRHCVGLHTRWRLEAGRGWRHCVGLHTR